MDKENVCIGTERTVHTQRWELFMSCSGARLSCQEWCMLGGGTRIVDPLAFHRSGAGFNSRLLIPPTPRTFFFSLLVCRSLMYLSANAAR